MMADRQPAAFDEIIEFEVTVAQVNDGGGIWVCVFDDLPEFVGHGDDEDEASDDLCAILNSITWH